MPRPLTRKHVRRLLKRLRRLERAVCPPDAVPQLIVHHIHHVATPEGPVDWDEAWRCERGEG